MHRIIHGLAALFVVSGISLLAASCGDGEVYDESGRPVCEVTADCYDGLVFEPNTRCIDNRCQCAVTGHIMCNLRGHPPDRAERACRAPEECEPGELGVPEEPPPPPPPAPECTSAADCSGPPSKECGAAVCIEGVCGVEIVPGPLESQRLGDCKRVVCDFSGTLVEEDDPSDAYDDGLECTIDICSNGSPASLTVLKIVCPVAGEGYCEAGACVQCADDADCKGTEICAYQRCVPDTCDNGMLDPATETDEDCGGSCPPCFVGDSCTAGSDCRSDVCKEGMCASPACNDDKKNNGETDVDCGADCPDKPCGDGKGCKKPADCKSGVCWGGTCQIPSCTDAVENGEETGVDCGGTCSGC